MGALVTKQLFQPPEPGAPENAELYSFAANGRLHLENAKTVAARTAATPVVSMHGKPTADTVVLFFHGNGEDLRVCEAAVDGLASIFDAHCMALEYPGYGVLAAEKASEASFYEAADKLGDATAAYVARLAQPNMRIMFVAYSLGAAVAVRAAIRFQEKLLTTVGAVPVAPMLVALAPFTSAFSTKLLFADRMTLLQPLDYFCTTCMLEQVRAASAPAIPLGVGSRFLRAPHG